MDSECFMKTVQACDVLLLKVLPIIVRVTSTRVRTAVRYQAPGPGMLYGNSLFWSACCPAASGTAGHDLPNRGPRKLYVLYVQAVRIG